MSAFLQLERVGRRFQLGPEAIDALHDVSLTIDRGECVAVTGPSGSGKSTLLNLIGLLDTPTSGGICWEGREVSQMSDDARTHWRSRRLGFIFQSSPMLPRLSVVENVALPLHYRRVAPAAALQAAQRSLALVGFAPASNRLPGGLSGGLLQRVAIARALVGEPELILADEPFAALDPDAAEQMLDLLLALNREQGTTLMVVTHSRSLAARCRRQLVLQDGNLVEPRMVARA